MLAAVDADADRLTRLITDLLDVSRIDAGRLRIHEVPLSVRATLQRHVERAVASERDADDFTVAASSATSPACCGIRPDSSVPYSRPPAAGPPV